MYVCVCHAITTDHVEAACRAKAPVKSVLGACGRGCGTCAPRLRELLRRLQSEEVPVAPAP